MDEDLLLSTVSTQSKIKVPWYTFIGDFFNILKAFIGTNYQALPFAFSNSGLGIGIFGVAVIAVLTDYCCNLLIKCKHIVIDNVVAQSASDDNLNEQQVDALRDSLNTSVGYGDLARRAFGGKWGNLAYHVVQLAVLFTQYLSCVAYFIFIGNTVMEMFPMVPATIPLSNSTPIHAEREYGVPILGIANIGHRYKRSLGEDDDLTAFPSHMYSHPLNLSHPSYVDEDYGDQESVKVGGQNFNFNIATNVTTESPISNVSTTEVLTTTPNATAPPTPVIYTVSSSPNLMLLMLFPLLFFMGTSLIRRLRKIAPFSVIASVALAVGAISIFIYLCMGFTVYEKGFSWYKISTLPIFVGQLISAYEGIGCIVPIETSMVGNQHVFKNFLHANVFIVFIILTAFGSLGYMRYGDDVHQLVVLNITQHTTLSYFIDITLIISVACTYPLQWFPVIEIVENYLFAPGSCCGPRPADSDGYEADEDLPGIQLPDDEDLMQRSIEISVATVAPTVPKKVPSWKRNVVRIFMTLTACGVAILARNQYAYLAAFSGAIACSLLAYILPCVIHLRLVSRTCHLGYIILHVTIACCAALASMFTLVVIIMRMVEGKMNF